VARAESEVIDVTPGPPNELHGSRFRARGRERLPAGLRRLWGKKRYGRTRIIRHLVDQAIEVLEAIMLEHPEADKRSWRRVSIPVWQVARISAALVAVRDILPKAEQKEQADALDTWAANMLRARNRQAAEAARHNQLVDLVEMVLSTKSLYTLDELRAEMVKHGHLRMPTRRSVTPTVDVGTPSRPGGTLQVPERLDPKPRRKGRKRLGLVRR